MNNHEPQKVILAELSMTGVFHTTVNTGFIRLMQAVYPRAAFRFYAEKSHLENCKKRLNDPAIDYRKLPVFPPTGKFTLPVRDFLGVLYILRLLFYSRKTDILFITNLLPLSHWCLFLLNRLLRRTVFIALHGQLEALLPHTPLRGTKQYFRMHRPLFRLDRHNHYILLGDSIYDAVKHLFAENAKVVVIDHPCDYDRSFPVTPLMYPLRLGQIGVGNRAKGTDKLFRLAELLKEEIELGQVEIHLIGRLDPELFDQINDSVQWWVEPLSQSDFEKLISSMNYSLLLRDSTQGAATASGSFFNTVRYGKPFLSLDSRFVRSYTERFPGCGAIFPSVEELAEAVRGLCRGPEGHPYAVQVENLLAMQKKLSIRSIAKEFNRQIRI